jgi:DNA-binding transcriptional ArsR family regulator
MKTDRCETVCIHQDKIEVVKKDILKDQKLFELSNLFKVISDPTRIRILYALEKQELCVCDIAVILDMTQSAISHQLKVLRLSRLVLSRKEGKTVFYRLSDEHVQKLFRQALDHIMEDN